MFSQEIKLQYTVRAPIGCMGDSGKTNKQTKTKLKLRINARKYPDGLNFSK